jgi:hypothetical protein
MLEQYTKLNMVKSVFINQLELFLLFLSIINLTLLKEPGQMTGLQSQTHTISSPVNP